MSGPLGAFSAQEPSAKYIVQVAPALVRGFGLFSTSLGAIAKLRELILSLAVQGKLVLQDQEDEPARLALGRMQAIKARLIADGKVKRDKTGADIDDREMPFDLPPGWDWAPLNHLTSVLNGRAYAKQELLDAGTPVLRVGNLFTSKHWYYSNLTLEEAKYCTAGDLLFAWSASFGPFIWPGPKAIYHYHIWKLALHSESDLDKNFLYTFLLGKTQEMKASGHGVSMIHMTKEAMEKIVVPLPPLAEQHRIVARVEELMKLCDALEQRGRLADEQHARLTSTLFDALAASESAHALAENWQRIAAHFDLLLDRPEAIDALEQMILQLAVRGLLLPQILGEASADQLLSHVIARRRTSDGDAESNTSNLSESVAQDAQLFPVRDSWRWVRVEEVCEVQGGIQKTQLRRPVKNHFPYLRVANVQRDRLNLDRIERYEVTDEEVERWALKAGDLLVVEGNGSADEVGRCAVWDGSVSPCVFQNHLMRVRPDVAETVGFLKLFLNSPDGAAEMKRLAVTTSGLFNLSVGKIRKIPVPLPPLAEQHRIVARVEELRRLCAQLRERLTAARHTQSLHADALVSQATS
ncbi:MAG TPA: restriction endonuclease subunit S [Burkholderiaceae bacterium]